MELIENSVCFGGLQQRYKHVSNILNCEMKFSVYLPPGASADTPVPYVLWLSGLTCSDQNFVHKAGAQRYAAELGVAVLAPDTSPRGEGVPDDPSQAWDFGLGAGFYVDATQSPWHEHYRMYSYITKELPESVERQLPLTNKKSIMGHSMGGHGALTIALKNPSAYCSVSAFSPICAPSQCAWGEKALGNYLGADRSVWCEYDACELVKKIDKEGGYKMPLWVDQGEDDGFLVEQLKPELLEQTCESHGHPLILNRREGYDHSYFYVASFIGEHLVYHSESLK